jgi:hypothetical protein
MGLLVAGITGGASLIKTAQLRSVVTESETYRTAFNTYYSQVGDVPTMTTSATAWTALKTNNITDKTAGTTGNGTGGVASKFRGAIWFFAKVGTSTGAPAIGALASIADFNTLNTLYVSGILAGTTHPFSQNDAKSIDDKIDDGKGTTGYVRGWKGSPVATGEADFTAGNNTNSLIIKLDF